MSHVQIRYSIRHNRAHLHLLVLLIQFANGHSALKYLSRGLDQGVRQDHLFSLFSAHHSIIFLFEDT